MQLDRLPIDQIIPDLLEAFRASRSAVLSAAPGAGKTTKVPLVLIREDWLAGRRIVMLEPRRLAAQRAARYMAALLGEDVGRTVGYRIRGESRVTGQTRIEVVTEGVLTRLLQTDPGLEGVGLVVFDEFHERSIHADLGLALTLDVQSHLRADLRILVMSATLDGLAVARLLGGIPVVEGIGRGFPVEVRYASFPVEGQVEQRVVENIQRALREEEGDVLVFLPGWREIRRVEMILREEGLPDQIRVHALHGEAAYERQRAALAPAPAGLRKVILSTNVAETSLTIDGVRVVVDSGRARSARFDPRRGMSGLVTHPVSRAAADQRCGRAGRQQAGVCYRLWTEEQHAGLSRYSVPEILTADLAPLALDLARWGSPDGTALRFLDRPPPAHLEQGRSLLRDLGAIDRKGSLTSHGRAMVDLPVHPRLSHMLLRAREHGLVPVACDVAAMLEERDLLRGRKDADIDLALRWHALRHGGDADRGVRARVLAQSHRIRGLLGVRAEPSVDESSLGVLLALAYPERIARRRGSGGGRYQMAGGTGGVLPERSLLAREQFLAIGEVDGVGAEVRVHLAAPLRQSDLEEFFPEAIIDEEEVRWSGEQEAVIARVVRRMGAMIIEERQIDPRGEMVLAAVVDGIRRAGLGCLPWDRDASSLRARSEWLRTNGLVSGTWPDLSDAYLLETLPEWLGPFLENMRRKEHLATLRLGKILRGRFSSAQLHVLESQAPTHLMIPAGTRIRLDYGSGANPVLAVRLQELFGETDTPRVANGRVDVLLHILSPAGRPVAVTQDLRSFWKRGYPEVRKELRGRYPKHYWPDNPLTASPTRGVSRSGRK